MSKVASAIPPSVENRISAWLHLQEHFKRTPTPRNRPTLTLSREYGCQAYPLALRLQDLFQAATDEPWNICDKSLVERVSREEHISLQLLENLGALSRRLDALGLQSPTHVTHNEAYAKVAMMVRQIARVGNAIVVGRGGAILCEGMPNCFHFRLVASQAFREATLIGLGGLTPEEAHRKVTGASQARAEFIRERLGAQVSDPRYYDAIFNNEHHDLDAIAQAIFAYVKASWKDPTTFRQAEKNSARVVAWGHDPGGGG